MKRLLLIGLLLLGLLPAHAQDTLEVYPGVTAWLQTLMEEPIHAINAKVDQFINQVGRQSPDKQSKVAGIAFDFFTASPVMGHEAVAIHIADTWFLNHRLEVAPELYPIVHTYVEFNRSSLIGAPAPELGMEDIHGGWTSVLDITTPYKVLFFYDTECSTCRREAPLLADLLRSYEGEPLTFIAIYTQQDHEAWETYVAETFSGIDNPAVTLIHLWDPEARTGYHKKYAVLSTPQLFLVDGCNSIAGRSLDAAALARLLELENIESLQYTQLFDRVFNSFNPLTIDHVEGVIDALAEKTREDESLFKESLLHLFNYLRSGEDFARQQGALYLAEKYIAAEPGIWPDSFLERTIHALAQARLNPVGERATQLKLQDRKGRQVNMLSGRHDYTVVFFHLLDCKQCQKELAALNELRSKLWFIGAQVVLVYVGEQQEAWHKFVKKQWPSRWKYYNDFQGTSGMRKLYDLEYVPHLYLLDENGVIIAKDIQVSELAALIPLL